MSSQSVVCLVKSSYSIIFLVYSVLQDCVMSINISEDDILKYFLLVSDLEIEIEIDAEKIIVISW